MKNHVTAPRAEAGSKPGNRQSSRVTADIVRIIDLIFIAGVGFGVYWFFLVSEQVALGSRYLSSIVIAVFVSGLLFHWLGVYGGNFVLRGTRRLGRALFSWACVFGLLVALAHALKIADSFSAVWAVSWFLATCGILVFARVVLVILMVRWLRDGQFTVRTVIVGTGEQGRKIAAHLERLGDIRIRIIGFIDDRTDHAPPRIEGHRVLGDVDTLIGLIRRNLVDRIIIALPSSEGARLVDLTDRLAATSVPVRLAPDVAGLEFPYRRFTQIAGVPMLRIFDRPISGWSFVAKTIEDRVLGPLFLVLLGPLMLLIALAIKIDSPGPVLFRQKRQGFNNELIQIWKFRSMHIGAEDPDTETQATRGDKRVTRVGRFLRKSSLDELPQLFNVLRGDMSIVGPRPHPLNIKAEGRPFEEVVDRYSARHGVKPGITGWAQVNGWRGETDTIEKIENRVVHDLYYIENWSLRFDLVILAKTPVAIFKAENAF